MQISIQSHNPEATVVRHAIAWTLLIFGIVMLGRTQFSEMALLQSPSPAYLAAVFKRSLESLYQLVLLSALLAVFPHFLLLVILDKERKIVAAYGQFSAWAQTLFTSLGFLGTIIGVSQAVSGLENAMRDNEPGSLIAGLSTAFDTTFLGLTAAMSLMCLRKLLEIRNP